MSADVLGERPLGARFRVPEVAGDVVPRPRLCERLRRGVRGPLTLVSAPAGSGKTTLLAEWVARDEAPGPVVWVTMDDSVAQPGALWASVIEGLDHTDDVRVEKDRRRGGPDVDLLLLDSVAGYFARRVEPVVLVLDAGDRFADRVLGGELSDVLDSCGDGLRVVLLTRSDPCLPLHRYRLDGEVTEIRIADLAFTPLEAAELVQRADLALSTAQVTALLDRTSGWAAGLRFAAMGLAEQHDIEAAIAGLRGDDGDVATYLQTEVLDMQPAEWREALLLTGMVDELQPGLFEALTGLSGRRAGLEAMARSGALIEPVPEQHGHYRYQPLFRELLVAQLADEQPAALPDQHRRAARWYAQRGQVHCAIEHAVAAGAWADAADHLVDDLGVGALVGGTSPYLELVVGMPREVEGVAAALVRAALAAAAGDLTWSAAELERVHGELRVASGGSSQARLLSLALLEAYVARGDVDVDAGLGAVGTVERLLRTSAVTVLVDEHPEVVVLTTLLKGQLLLLQGDLAAAAGAMSEARRIAAAPGCEALLIASHGWGALTEVLTGNLRRATDLADRADALASDHSVERGSRLPAAEVARAWIAMEHYDIDAACRLVEHAVELRADDDVVTAPVLALVRARLARATGDLDAARAELRACRSAVDPGRSPVWLTDRLGAEEAALVLAQGHPEEARAVVDGLADPSRPEAAPVRELVRLEGRESTVTVQAGPYAQRGGHPLVGVGSVPLDARVGALLAEATRCVRAGDTTRATVVLERSLRLAGPERLRRPFHEASPAVRRLLRPGSESVRRHPWLVSLDQDQARGLSVAAQPGGTLVVEPLTAKEREVLSHLADLHTTAEIAEEMFVSVNTVRTHVRSILRKLGASRRNEAVRRAWELGLLPQPGDVPSRGAGSSVRSNGHVRTGAALAGSGSRFQDS